MRFRRTVAVTLTVVVGAGLPVARGAVPPGVELTVAKSQRYVIGFGTATGVRPGDRLVVTLLRSPTGAAGSFERVARERFRFGPNTRSKRSFTARLARPVQGLCRVRALHRRNGRVRARAVGTVACHVPTFELGRAVLDSSQGTRTIDALIAETPEQRGYGLSFRRRLAADRGMAFLFEGDTNAAFWMKDTLIPLSIAFTDAHGVILRILDMEPCRADPCPVYDPQVTYRNALEVNRGAFKEWGISEGGRITIEP